MVGKQMKKMERAYFVLVTCLTLGVQIRLSIVQDYDYCIILLTLVESCKLYISMQVFISQFCKDFGKTKTAYLDEVGSERAGCMAAKAST